MWGNKTRIKICENTTLDKFLLYYPNVSRKL
ncbi:hypothetical protein [Clostridium sp. CTA-19]